MKIQDIYNLAEGITALSDKELPTKTAFKISRNQRKIESEVGTCDEVRKKIIEKYKESDTDDGVKIQPDKYQEFKTEYDELMKQEIDIELSDIMLDELGDTAKPRTLMLLENIVKEGAE